MKYGLIGEHLKHSFSKVIHEEIGDYVYEIKEIEPQSVEAFMKANVRYFRVLRLAERVRSREKGILHFAITFSLERAQRYLAISK